VNRYSGELGAQNKSLVELNFRGSELTVMKKEMDYSCRWSNVKSRK
jgi:hypothetical protein